MNLSAWSIRNPIPAVMLFVLLTLAGLLSFRAMKVQNFPDMDLPVVMVTAVLPGAAPGQLESDVARKIENAIATTQGLKHITTTLTDGVATIAAEYQLEKPVQEAVDDVRSAVSRVRADLPADLRDPIVAKLELSAQPILAFAIASKRMDDEALSWFMDDTLTRRLLAVPGVGAVNRVGGVMREVRVALDPLKLQALGATAAEVSRQLRQVQIESAGGRADLGGAEQPVRTLATVQTAGELAALDIPLGDGRHIRLDQVATVRDTVAEQRTAALLDGQQVIGFEVSRSRGASEVDVSGPTCSSPAPWISCRLPATSTPAPCTCCTRAPSSRWWWCGCFCATGGPPSFLPWRCRSRSSRPSSACTCWGFPSTSLRCWRSRWWWASWWTTPSSRWKTSCAICAWERALTKPPWKRPTKLAWPSSPPPSR